MPDFLFRLARGALLALTLPLRRRAMRARLARLGLL